MRNNNFVSKNSNSVFIILISLFIIVFVIVGYFMLSDNMFKSSYNEPSRLVTSCVEDCTTIDGDNEVFNIRDNMFTYNEARAMCAAHDAKLASLEEMIEAYKNGANWCSYGWSEGQLALYPTQPDFWNKLQNDPYRKYECGKPGVNGGYFENPEFLFGATCYGVKPKDLREKEENRLVDSSDYDAYYENQDLNKLNILPFNESKWNQ